VKHLGVKFGDIVEIKNYGYFIFTDLMPPKWKHFRVDIYHPDLKWCKSFGLKRGQIEVTMKINGKPDPDGDWKTTIKLSRRMFILLNRSKVERSRIM
jgi:hypothetical protein